MMAYEPTEWKDHIVQHPNRYRIADRGDGTVDIVPEQGQVIQQGTPVDAQRLNKIEQGIKDAHDEIASHKADNTNPHNVTKAQVGLSNVDNMSATDIRTDSTRALRTEVVSSLPQSPEKGRIVFLDDPQEPGFKGYDGGKWV